MEILMQKPELPRLPAGAGRDRPLVDFFAEANSARVAHSVREAPREDRVAGHVNVSPNFKQSPAKSRKNKTPARKHRSPVKESTTNVASARDATAGGLAYHLHSPNVSSIPPPLELLIRK
eukprot:jgi/Ulvmu1/8308/UM042_0013.1